VMAGGEESSSDDQVLDDHGGTLKSVSRVEVERERGQHDLPAASVSSAVGSVGFVTVIGMTMRVCTMLLLGIGGLSGLNVSA
jgi:hypothetical protein